MPKVTANNVVCLVRVSTEEQEWERQRRRKQRILKHFNLEELEEIALKVSGTAVEKTTEYKHAVQLLERPDVVGMVVPQIDRWFRYKLISEIGRYVEPFESMMDGGKNKLVYSTVNEEYKALDLRKRADQDLILDGVRYASKEREVITGRMTEGKDIGREDPEVKIDETPSFVRFTPYRQGVNRGVFSYNEFAYASVKPLYERFHAGEPLYRLAKELGFKTVMSARHALSNVWVLGVKHRTRHVSIKEWSDELNRFRHRGVTKHDNPIMVKANMDCDPLISEELFRAVQNKLAVRSVEYGKRKSIIDEFLLAPLLHCEKCGARMYGRKGSKYERPDRYICATRYRKQTCDAPIFNAAKLDKIAVNKMTFVLTNPANTKRRREMIEEGVSTQKQEEARAKVEAAKRIVAELEKKVNRVRTAIEESDDRKLPGRLKELNAELASAHIQVTTAEAAVAAVPVIDVDKLERKLRRDFLNFGKLPRDEQKRILAKWVKNVTAFRPRPEETGDYDEPEHAECEPSGFEPAKTDDYELNFVMAYPTDADDAYDGSTGATNCVNSGNSGNTGNRGNSGNGTTPARTKSETRYSASFVFGTRMAVEKKRLPPAK